MTAERDYFIGHWHRYGGDPFFPDKIIMEGDPNSPDRLLVSFTLGCQHPNASCSANKVRSAAAATLCPAPPIAGRGFLKICEGGGGAI
jgi:hypothetical protein